jgi:hypothetical protein
MDFADKISILHFPVDEFGEDIFQSSAVELFSHHLLNKN